MQGALLTVLMFLLTAKNIDGQNWRLCVGKIYTSFWIKHYFQMLAGSWPVYSAKLVVAEKLIILFTETFVNNVKCDNGMQFKLAKIHQLQHFVPQIREFGSASNITGCIEGSSHGWLNAQECKWKHFWIPDSSERHWQVSIDKACSEVAENGKKVLKRKYLAEFKDECHWSWCTYTRFLVEHFHFDNVYCLKTKDIKLHSIEVPLWRLKLQIISSMWQSSMGFSILTEN